MEPLHGSSAQIENVLPSFVHHRNKNMSVDEDTFHSSGGGGVVDSGYVSSNCITLNNTPNILCSSSLNQTPNRLCGSGNLVTIEENNILGESVKLTPVTQNIRKICDFHITTPKVKDNIEPTGCKRNSVGALDFDTLESTPKKSKFLPDFTIKNDDIIIGRTDKYRPKSRKLPFRQKLKSAPDLDSYFGRKNIENIFSPRKGDLSPILNKNNIREKRTPLANTTNNLLQSSTPKSCGYRSSYYTGHAKYKPTSVKKLLAFTDNQFDCLLKSGKEETAPKEKSTLAKDSFEFYEQELKDIYHEQKEKDEGICETQSNEFLPLLMEAEDEKCHDEKKKVELNLSQIDEECKIEIESDLKESQGFHEDEEEETDDIVNSNFDIKSNIDLSLNLDIVCESELSPLHVEESIKCKSPIKHKEKGEQQIKELPKTPKKIKRHSIDHERLEILYPTIPRTPSKYIKMSHACNKRYLNDNKKQIQRQSHVKEEPSQRKFYDGITYLNIITKLESYTVVLEKILNMLSSQDLVNMTKVSNSWRKIVRSNQHANVRRLEYIKKCKSTKENDSRIKYEPIIIKKYSTSKGKEIEAGVRVPFSQNNFRIDRKRCHEMERSPPVSPSKRKFYENQKVVRTLGSNDKLIKCPRCEKSSRIINSLSSESPNDHHNVNINNNNISNNNNNNNSNNNNSNINHDNPFKTTSFQAKGTLKSMSKTRNFYSFDQPTPTKISPTFTRRMKFVKSKSVDTAFLPFLNKDSKYSDTRQESIPFYSYGECSGQTCKFRFCLDCLCEYHPESECKISAPISPSKEDVQNGILQLNSPYSSSTHGSGRNFRRKSLKRLCF